MSTAIGRNYAEVLFELGSREDAVERYGELLDEVATLYEETPEFRAFLETPRVPRAGKEETLRASMTEAPESFLRFLLVVMERRRQRTLPEMAKAYRELLDDRLQRRRAIVTLAFEADEALRREIVEAIERRVERDVVPEFRVDPSLLGGMVIQVEDRFLDASLKRGLERLKWELISA